MSLYNITGPVVSGSVSSDTSARIVLLDDVQQLRSTFTDLPSLPPSFRGAAGDRYDGLLAGQRIVFVGCGKLGDYTSEQNFWWSAGALVIDALRALKIESAALSGALLPVQIAKDVAAQNFTAGATISAYRCTGYRTIAAKDHFSVQKLLVPAEDADASSKGFELAAAINWARALVDAPANLLTPASFAEQALELKALGVTVEVLDMAALEKLGAGGLLAVGGSSQHAPCMVICRWNGRTGDETDLGFVGKGLTFDAGGLNLKPRPVIEKMKFDMAGAAAVLGAIRLLANRKAKLNVVAAIPLAENVIDGSAYRPGDVIRSMSGLTIEVLDTDAEGRIVLADGMTYLIQNHKPAVLIDIATLTGAIMSALHEEYAGLFTSDDELARLVEGAAETSSESVWRMPLTRRHDYLVESEIADVKNLGAPGFMGSGSGSSISGAKFLEKFAEGTRWAHLDIAGVAWSTRPQPGIPKGATGFGVKLLNEVASRIESK